MGVANTTPSDADMDCAGDFSDNCIALPNPGQEDCDGNSVGNTCEIASGAEDCNMNGILDACELASTTSQALKVNTIPDECGVNGGTPFCFGCANCPCGDDSVLGSGQGSVNSSGSGASLLGTGLTSLSLDGLLMNVSNLPIPSLPGGSNFALRCQGTSQGSLPFHDGIRCAGGTEIRPGTKSHVTGSTSFPQMGDSSVSATGLVGGPGARYYPVWYRDALGQCATGSNFSNVLSVIWIP